ncbi:Aldose 1-epimerase [Collimonas arenae]|uniref:Putative glucose-6-phosphate 1-epimerase n=1 Tax=Collimonas arenae TaxID=279058 RepID=A0A0A1FJE7_9BURK|nr:D-hexose-6-phosphate mutarotase [Collimonas arenae]AIY43835.1 Aldose 1-epimerase [Collimonas arenae]
MPTSENLQPTNQFVTVASADGAQVQVTLHGGHVCSWRTPDGVERLFMSPLNAWRSDSAIRGGVPVIFPQFASEGPLPKHGFARLSLWTLLETSTQIDGSGLLRLALSDSEETRRVFPHAFSLELRIEFSGQALNTELIVTNNGDQPFDFTCALHTYLSTLLAETAIYGLAGNEYRDSVDGRRIKRADQDVLHIKEEVDRVYFSVDKPITLSDHKHSVIASQTGFVDAVVWNPWENGCAKIADLMLDSYQHFVCVEAATIQHPVTLTPKAIWRGSQHLECLSIG